MAKPPLYYVLTVAVVFGAIAGVVAWLVSRMIPGAPEGLIGGFFAGAVGVLVPVFINWRAARRSG